MTEVLTPANMELTGFASKQNANINCKIEKWTSLMFWQAGNFRLIFSQYSGLQFLADFL